MTASWQERLLGQTVGHYRIVKCLGSGGMGAVFLGEHPRIQSQVAVKILHRRYVAEPSIVRRFLDEARAVNRVGHPGIVRIHDSGTDENVGVYLVMELLQGQTLLACLEAVGMLDPDLVARWLRQAAGALAAAHGEGIIHRDLKPSNIFLVDDAEVVGGWRVKVLDFGVAKLIEDQDSGGGQTRTGMVIGSPQYMSPEQCLDAKAVDARSDIFSLGVIGHLLLAGQLPFPGKSVGQVLLSHRQGPATPLRQLRPEVPEALEACITRAMAMEPDDRFGTMLEMEAALRRAHTRVRKQEDETKKASPAAVSVTNKAVPAPTPTIKEPASEAERPARITARQDSPPENKEASPLEAGTLLHDGPVADLLQPSQPDEASSDLHEAGTMLLQPEQELAPPVEAATLIEPEAVEPPPRPEPEEDTATAVSSPDVPTEKERPSMTKLFMLGALTALLVVGAAAVLILGHEAPPYPDGPPPAVPAPAPAPTPDLPAPPAPDLSIPDQGPDLAAPDLPPPPDASVAKPDKKIVKKKRKKRRPRKKPKRRSKSLPYQEL